MCKKFLIIIFFVLITLPTLLFDFKSDVSVLENRTLAKLPKIRNGYVANINIFKELDAYIKDRFGLRYGFLSINNYISALEITGNFDRAIKGKQGWLFLIDTNEGDNLSDFLRNNLVSQQYATDFAESIKKRADWCEANGIKFIFLIAPNKHNIYPEFYPLEGLGGISRTEQLMVAMDTLNVEYLYPKSLLLKHKNIYETPLYYRLGTHWNELGAYITYKEMLLPAVKKAIGDKNVEKLEFEYIVEESSTEGDRELLPMLGIIDNSTQPMVKFNVKGKKWHDLYTEERFDIEGRKGLKTINYNNNKPKAIIFRDSFFIALQPFTSTLFSEADYRWKFFEESDKDYILNNKPDIIIMEHLERYVPIITLKEFN